jgi:tartrate dehydrogenase/decarboxylase/D-malate dehydrogenase
MSDSPRDQAKAKPSRTYRLAVIPGDGIGVETTASALEVLDRVSALCGFGLDLEMHPWGCDFYARTGRMMAPDACEQMRDADAVFLGAIGRPDVSDRLSVWELVLPIRRTFQQYVNIRPIRLFEGVDGPLRNRVPDEIELVVVRENTEGEYADIGGSLHPGSPEEVCAQLSVFTRAGTERAARYAFELAQLRRGKLTSATKSNGLPYSMPFWDAVVEDVAREYPAVELASIHIDALAGLFVLDPARFDVVLGSNLFGDILSDLGAAIAGSIGMGPSANLNPEGEFPSMFEPIHGSAPDIGGLGIANPVGQIWSASMMLEHLGEQAGADAIFRAIAEVLRAREVRTPDLGGAARTAEFTDAIVAALDIAGPGDAAAAPRARPTMLGPRRASQPLSRA